MNEDLRLIKKHYGERMMQLCRALFPTLLEEPGRLYKKLSSNFAFSHYLYNDIVQENKILDFKDFIYAQDTNERESSSSPSKTPRELLKSVGYTLYEIKTKEELEKFRKYYRKDELLCTYKDNRLKRCFIFFAVKDNADELNREQFKNPQRQDEYGTSVISIQFDKGDYNFLSIKNRYNDTVPNPDATFSNNLDSIVLGLTESFAKEYHLNIFCNANIFDMNNYIRANDCKYYKYNYEINDIHYCTDNIIIDNGKVINDYKEKEKYIIFDYYILDLKNKKIELYDKNIDDTFIQNLKPIDKINVIKENDKKTIKITTPKGEYIIEIDQYNRMTSYKDNQTIIANDNFLKNNFYLKKLEMTKLKKINDNSLKLNTKLEQLITPELEWIENNVLQNNLQLESIYIPKLKYIGNKFLMYNNSIKNIYLPSLKSVGNAFLSRANKILEINLPELKTLGNNVLECANNLKKITLPKLEIIGNSFLEENIKLEQIYIPKVLKIGTKFLLNNNSLKTLDCPKLLYAGDDFLTISDKLEEISFPALKYIGDNFMMNNQILEINLPSVEYIGNSFMEYNKNIIRFKANKLAYIGNDFMQENESLEELEINSIETIKDNFLCNLNRLKKLILPNLKEVGNSFLSSDNRIKIIDMPNLTKVGYAFLLKNNAVKILNAPKLIKIGENFLCNNTVLEEVNINDHADCTYNYLYNYLLLTSTGKEKEITF